MYSLIFYYKKIEQKNFTECHIAIFKIWKLTRWYWYTVLPLADTNRHRSAQTNLKNNPTYLGGVCLICLTFLTPIYNVGLSKILPSFSAGLYFYITWQPSWDAQVFIVSALSCVYRRLFKTSFVHLTSVNLFHLFINFFKTYLFE